MRKWGNTHCTSLRQTSDVSLLQSPKVIRKSMSIYCHSLRVHLCLMPKGIHSIMICKLALCIASYILHFWPFVTSLLNLSTVHRYFAPTSTRSHFEASSVSCIVMNICIFVLYIQHFNRRECTTASYLCETILYTNIVDICRHSMQFFAIAC